MTVLIIAPHQDDEILSSYYYIREQLQKGVEVKILFVTNGDYKGPVYAKMRYSESVAALQELGLPLNNIYYMGYADTGMRLEKSFLYRLYYNESDDTIQHSPFSDRTYHPNGGNTLHAILHGQEAIYTRKNLLTDLKDALDYFNPNIIILPSQFDFHGDHKAVNYFIRDIFQENSFPIKLMYYLIHSGDTLFWPNHSYESYLRAECLPESLWENRITIWANTFQWFEKKAAIQMFKSQSPNALNGFLLRFAKKEEIFLNA